MKPPKGIYKIPNLKLAFFVIPSPENNNSKLPLSKKTTEYFEHILQSKDRVLPRADRLWKIKIVYECDFLSTIEQCMPRKLEYTNQSPHTLQDMGLLAMSLTKSSVDNPTYSTPKLLETVEIEDIIEVFI